MTRETVQRIERQAAALAAAAARKITAAPILTGAARRAYLETYTETLAALIAAEMEG